MEDPVDFDEEKLQRKAEKALDSTIDYDFGTDMEQKIKEMKKRKEKVKQESESKIPFTWDPREIKYFTNNRKKMDNEELKQFLKKDSEIQEEIRETDWEAFSRREERFIVQNHLNMETEDIAEKINRDEKKVRMKMRTMGLQIDDF